MTTADPRQQAETQTLLDHPRFAVLQRVGTRAWSAYFFSSSSGHAAYGGGDTALAALQNALSASSELSNADLF